MNDHSPKTGGTDEHAAGFVAVCGRPNVGKSTLVNALVGQAVAVATRLPQTTRERMLGIWSGPGFQAVLVDTPGMHRARSALNRYMVDEAIRGAREVDVVLLLAETPSLGSRQAALDWEPGPVATEVLRDLVALGHPVILVLTKIDRLGDRGLLLPVIERWAALHEFAAIVPTSALEGDGLEGLRGEVVARLPQAPPYFDPDQLSDRNLRWHAAELVRAELFEQLEQELPYSCAVTIEEFREHGDRDTVRAMVHVEREGQKRVVIGQGGRRIKSISVAARKRIERLTDRPCELFLRVRVDKHWTRDPDQLARLGYGKGDRS